MKWKWFWCYGSGDDGDDVDDDENLPDGGNAVGASCAAAGAPDISAFPPFFSLHMSESTAMLVKRGYPGEGICRQGNNRHGGLTRERDKTRDRQNMSACFALTENCRE
ncbi:hypothetical protein KQX54_001106 [Cotesia glomerata]|uniref:Uncharacterized protein n=1 Tax=Cotesia glomerata TaxID=32391 RepID=A0AAV7HTV4_COTGL|nr:hypothetical protein KQX54_001106 [Cotesia glomerata]